MPSQMLVGRIELVAKWFLDHLGFAIMKVLLPLDVLYLVVRHLRRREQVQSDSKTFFQILENLKMKNYESQEWSKIVLFD